MKWLQTRSLLGVFERDSDLLRAYVLTLHRCCNRVLTAQVTLFHCLFCCKWNMHLSITRKPTRSLILAGENDAFARPSHLPSAMLPQPLTS